MPLISLNDSHSRAHVHSSVFSRANINNNICKSFHYYLSSLRVARVRAARSVSANMYQANHRINFDALLLCSCCIHVEWPRSNAQHQAPGNVCAIATYWMSSASFFIHPAIVRSSIRCCRNIYSICVSHWVLRASPTHLISARRMLLILLK